MTHNKLFRPANDLIIIYILILLLILPTLSLHAQSPTDFSGKWVFDISKSKSGEHSTFGSGDMTHIIIQKPSTITIEKIIGNQKGSIINSFPLDGKETTENQGPMTIKRSATWSQDKKTLILTIIMTISGKEYRVEDSYKLSDNELILTINSVSKDINGESLTVWIFNKKKN